MPANWIDAIPEDFKEPGQFNETVRRLGVVSLWLAACLALRVFIKAL